MTELENFDSAKLKNILKEMPKIELHAHLNGCLSRTSMIKLAKYLYGDNLTPMFLKQCQEFEEDLKVEKFQNEPSIQHHSTLSKCFEKFALIHELTSSAKGLRMATDLILRDFYIDSVVYLELRTTPKANKYVNRRQYLQTVLEAIEDYCKINSKMNVKLLVSIDRAQSKEVADEIVNLAIEFKQRYPKFIKGIDFSGNPTKGNFEEFIPSLSKAKQHNIPLALHCGELLNTQMEAQIMLDFGFQRCGHGTHLSHEQYQQCKSQNITVECCLTSNVKCGTVPSYGDHHFIKLYHEGIKVVLCTDDSGVFNTTLTEEFTKAVYEFKMDIMDIYELSMNAIDAAFAENDEKQQLKKTIYEFYLSNKKVISLFNDRFHDEISKKYEDFICKQK